MLARRTIFTYYSTWCIITLNHEKLGEVYMVICLYSHKKLVLQQMGYIKEMGIGNIYNPSWNIFWHTEHLTEKRHNNYKQWNVISVKKIGQSSLCLIKHYVVKTWGEDIDSRFMKFGTILRWMSSLRHQPLYSSGWSLGWAPEPAWTPWRTEKYLPPTRNPTMIHQFSIP